MTGFLCLRQRHPFHHDNEANPWDLTATIPDGDQIEAFALSVRDYIKKGMQRGPDSSLVLRSMVLSSTSRESRGRRYDPKSKEDTL